MKRPRFILALWIAKLTRLSLKAAGRNATYLPGKIAIGICSDFLGAVGKPNRIIAVTGTNGKTTVSNLLDDILEQNGYRVLNNRMGSNVAAGVATSLLSGCTIWGRSKYPLAVLEIDERSSMNIYPYVRPDFILITNLTRDSIPRNAHPEFIAGILNKSIPKTSKLILNGDDLISAFLAPENQRAYFGISRLDTDVSECVNIINDMPLCPRCGGNLQYDYRRYHHIGHAHCESCGFHSPDCGYLAEHADQEAMTISVSDGREKREFKLLSDSIFNMYNMVAAIALLREFGLPYESIENGIAKADIVESRYFEEAVGDVRIVSQMAKELNAQACSRAFDYVSGQPGDKILILMIYNLLDVKNGSENICWLYDCDFEFLSRENIKQIIVTGPRAKDYYLRLLLAGVPAEKISCTLQETDAVFELKPGKAEDIYILYGIDEIGAALEVRKQVAKFMRERNAK